MSNRTNEALLERRALAEKATEGPWEQASDADALMSDCWRFIMAKREDASSIHSYEIADVSAYGRREDAAHIAANSPDVVMADIDEIIRLRAENTWLDREAIYLATLLTLITDPEIGLDSQKSEVTRELVDLIKEKHSRTTVYTWLKAARKAVEEIEFMEENQ